MDDSRDDSQDLVPEPVDPPVKVPLAFERVLAAAAMAALCLITLANVLVRYLTNYSFAFTEEYSVALMVLVTLLGAGIATASDRQIRITWFGSLLPRRGERAFQVAAVLSTIVMFVLLVVLGGRMVWDEYRFEVTSPGLGAPQWLYTVIMPVFAAAVAGRAIGYLWRMRRS